MTASIGTFAAKPSHMIFHVAATDETIAFYQSFLDASVSDDHTFSAPSLDAIFGRSGVVIRLMAHWETSGVARPGLKLLRLGFSRTGSGTVGPACTKIRP